MSFYEDFFQALEVKKVRYMVVGGLAVILHGFVRGTADLDLMVALDKKNLSSFLNLMKKRGYKPKVPVPIGDFADSHKRKIWKEEKGMLVFSLYHPQKPGELIDVFIYEPIPFSRAYQRRKLMKYGEASISVIGINDLIQMKKKAGRHQDREDIKALKFITKRKMREKKINMA